MELHPVSFYAARVRKALPAGAFAPAPGRLSWLALHLAVAAAGMVLIARGTGGWPLAVPLSFLVGHGFAGMAFVAHETLHGSVVRGRRLRHLVGWLAFLPFTLSPILWVAWHNREHHGNTMKAGRDPDTFPSLDAYRASRRLRVSDRLTVGTRRWAGWLGLLLGFTGQSLSVLFTLSRQRGWLGAAEHRRALAETALGVAVWAALAIFLGPRFFLLGYVVPLLVGNAIVMTYIFTNHSLSPLTEVNDPLVNTLTVTTPRLVTRLHLGFGYHVEHHLFPAMSPRHAPRVREELMRLWPERYTSMPLGRAVRRLWTTARIYLDPATLVDPRSGRTWPTLAPRVEERRDAEVCRGARATAQSHRAPEGPGPLGSAIGATDDLRAEGEGAAGVRKRTRARSAVGRRISRRAARRGQARAFPAET